MKTVPRELRAIVFDFDGTLALLNIDFKEMRRDILDLAGSFGITEAGLAGLFVLEMIAEANRRIVTVRPEDGAIFTSRAMRLVTDRELAGAGNSRLFPGVKEMLSELRHRGLKTAILTRNCLKAVTSIFPDIRDYSDAVVTRDETERVKPHPDHLLAVLRLLEENPSRTAMVGDHPMDVRVGRDVGALTIGVLTGYSSAEDLEGAGADLILERATDITSHMGQR